MSARVAFACGPSTASRPAATWSEATFFGNSEYSQSKESAPRNYTRSAELERAATLEAMAAMAAAAGTEVGGVPRRIEVWWETIKSWCKGEIRDHHLDLAGRPPARQVCRTPCSSHPALTAGRCASRSCNAHGKPQ